MIVHIKTKAALIVNISIDYIIFKTFDISKLKNNQKCFT